MSVTDILLMMVILGLAGWVFHLTYLKKGGCAGCKSCRCGKDKPLEINGPLSRPKDGGKISSANSRRMVRLPLAVMAVLGILLAAPASHAGHPMITDDAGTVGKGKGQIEFGTQLWHDKDLVDEFNTQKNEGGEAALAITIGLHDRLDVVLGVPYQWFTTYENGNRVFRADGLADIGLDLKWRFFDGDGWAFALKPGIMLPSGDDERGLGNGRTAYRLFLIASKELAPWAFHLNLGYIRNENTAGDHRDVWHASLAAELEIVKDFKAVADIGVERSPVPVRNDHPAFALCGLVYALSERISVDGGVKFGLTHSETDVTYLFGMTMKF